MRIKAFQLVIVATLIVTFFYMKNSTDATQEESAQNGAEAYEVLAPQTVQVVLERVYLDGEKSKEYVEETILSMEDFWAFYEDWELIDQNGEEIIFRKEMFDISPLLKINGYFGLTEEGVLTIFEGEPSHEKVIQTFFYIDTSKLKSHHYTELENGIPVKDLRNYEEVLQVFSQYKAKEI
ncbi:intercompartmental signaling factor BofC [Alkalihalobacillus hemicellulosilyticus]|uniref:Bypass-of-forespore protein C n=1 Tax=Halalkalibacter hemicellulosilyticusJCM 9152 TaxID=1236971 RepID=W4QEC4_9BACI|nr:intercompartmental signaling factor BofC [Halalkalibacter hemicellulosilyticus]GAE30405.1 bypass-of-forespore protein C [Halalkalibacter hemicellulosilyticusJCM 9152]